MQPRALSKVYPAKKVSKRPIDKVPVGSMAWAAEALKLGRAVTRASWKNPVKYVERRTTSTTNGLWYLVNGFDSQERWSPSDEDKSANDWCLAYGEGSSI